MTFLWGRCSVRASDAVFGLICGTKSDFNLSETAVSCRNQPPEVTAESRIMNFKTIICCTCFYLCCPCV